MKIIKFNWDVTVHKFEEFKLKSQSVKCFDHHLIEGKRRLKMSREEK
jgi:hypothetical protein